MDISSLMLPPRCLQRQQSAFNPWFVTLPPGWSPEAVKQPTFWMHHSATVQIKDTIVVVTPALDWWGQFLVIDKGDTFLILRELLVSDARTVAAKSGVPLTYAPETVEEPPPTDKPGGYVAWGGIAKWRVMDRQSRRPITGIGHATRDAAEAELAEYLRKIGVKQAA